MNHHTTEMPLCRRAGRAALVGVFSAAMLFWSAPVLAQHEGEDGATAGETAGEAAPAPRINLRPQPHGAQPRPRFIEPIMTQHDPKDEVDLGDGLNIVDVRPGKGTPVTDGAFLLFHFSAFTTDGDLLDTSRQPRRRPASAKVPGGEMFPSWEKGMMGLRAGGTRKILIPARLGPGPEGFGPIPGDDDLVIEVEMLAVAPTIDGQYARKHETGTRSQDVVAGEGPTFDKTGFATCHFTIWDEQARIVGSTRVGGSATVLSGESTQFWAPYAFGARAGAQRILDLEAPDMGELTEGEAEPGPRPRWRMLLEFENVTPPIVQTPHDPKDEVEVGRGVRVVVLKPGEGETMPERHLPKIHYSAWYDDGRLMDSTRKPGNDAIVYSPGLYPSAIQLGLKDIRRGEKRKILVPPNVDFGDFVALPADSAFVFEIELLSWEEPIFWIDESTIEFGDGGEDGFRFDFSGEDDDGQ